MDIITVVLMAKPKGGKAKGVTGIEKGRHNKHTTITVEKSVRKMPSHIYHL
jgi:hypothetical protein